MGQDRRLSRRLGLIAFPHVTMRSKCKILISAVGANPVPFSTCVWSPPSFPSVENGQIESSHHLGLSVWIHGTLYLVSSSHHGQADKTARGQIGGRGRVVRRLNLSQGRRASHNHLCTRRRSAIDRKRLGRGIRDILMRLLVVEYRRRRHLHHLYGMANRSPP